MGSRFTDVAEYASRHRKADIGVHLAILSDSKKHRLRPLSPRSRVASLVDREGFFLSDHFLLSKRAEPEHVLRECDLQIAKALRAGLKPTHLDGHRDAFSFRKDLALTLAFIAREHGLPFRTSSAGKRTFTLSPEVPASEAEASYLGFLEEMKQGVFELVVHPGVDSRELRKMFGKDAPWGSAWRQRDYELIRSRSFRAKLRQREIRLIRWRDLEPDTLIRPGPLRRDTSCR